VRSRTPSTSARDAGASRRPSVLVVCFDDRAGKSAYVDEFRRRNAAALTDQGADFDFRELDPYGGEVPTYWIKIAMMRDALLRTSAEWVVWIDSDVLITGDLVGLLASRKSSFVCSTDVDGLGAASFLNAGVFAARNCERGRDTVDKIWGYVAEGGPWSAEKMQWHDSTHKLHPSNGIFARIGYEQGSINRVFVDDPDRIEVLPHCEVYGNGNPFPIDGPVAVHMMGMRGDERMRALQDMDRRRAMKDWQ
jgi:hypothetical protein